MGIALFLNRRGRDEFQTIQNFENRIIEIEIVKSGVGFFGGCFVDLSSVVGIRRERMRSNRSAVLLSAVHILLVPFCPVTVK